MLLSNIQNTRMKNIINPELQTVLQTLYERKIVCIKNYAKQRTLEGRKNFTNYIKPIKTM